MIFAGAGMRFWHFVSGKKNIRYDIFFIQSLVIHKSCFWEEEYIRGFEVDEQRNWRLLLDNECVKLCCNCLISCIHISIRVVHFW